jgi:hypothetical protein
MSEIVDPQEIGFVWHRGAGVFSGWAWDPSTPKDVMTVRIYLNGRSVGSVVAEDAAFDDARPPEASFRGFEDVLPGHYRVGKLVHIAFKSVSGRELAGSPILFQLRTPDTPDDSFPTDQMYFAFIELTAGISVETTAKQGMIYYSLDQSALVESDYSFATSHRHLGRHRAHQAYQPYLPYAASIKEVFVDLDRGTIFLPDGRIWQSSTYLLDTKKFVEVRNHIIRGNVDGEVNEPAALINYGHGLELLSLASGLPSRMVWCHKNSRNAHHNNFSCAERDLISIVWTIVWNTTS